VKRSVMTQAKRVRIFDAAKGICYLCSNKIELGEAWEVEHPIALELGGSDQEADLRPAHVDCHKPKTRGDRQKIAKVHRVRARHIGAHKSRQPFRGWLKFDGTLVWKDRR
jgi:5-methylcytosine-specific restriction protein A